MGWRRSVRRAVALLLGLAAAAAHGDEWSVANKVQARVESNDNYQLLASPNGSVNQLLLTETVSAARRSETANTRADASVTVVTLRGTDAGRNRTDGQLSLHQDLTVERETYALDLGYVRDTTFDNELVSTGVVLTRGRRESENANATWTHAFTERLNASAQAYVSSVRYQHEVNGGSSYDYVGLAAATSYLLSEVDSLKLQASHSDYRTRDGSNRATSDNLTLSWAHAPTERAAHSLGIGVYRTRTVTPQFVPVCGAPVLFCQLGLQPYEFVTKPVGSDDLGGQFNAALHANADDRTDVDLRASRSVTPSGAGVLLQTDTASIGATRTWSPRTKLGVDASVSQARYLGIDVASHPRYQTVGLYFNHAVTTDLTFEAGYRYALSVDTVSARSNLFYASLTLDWPKLATSR